jgi:hypothetical protein
MRVCSQELGRVVGFFAFFSYRRRAAITLEADTNHRAVLLTEIRHSSSERAGTTGHMAFFADPASGLTTP